MSFRCAFLTLIAAPALGMGVGCAQSGGSDVNGWIDPDTADAGPVDPQEDGAAKHPQLEDAALVHADANGEDDADPDADQDAAKDAGKLDAGKDAARDAGKDASVDAHDAAAAHDAAKDSAPDGQVPVDSGTASDATTPTGCTLLINEVMTGVTGSGTTEFVEVYNTCATPLAIGDWKIVYRAGTVGSSADPANDSAIMFKWAVGTTIPANGLLVYGGAGFTGTKDGTLTGGLKDGSGSVAVRNAAGTIVDSLGYGASTIVTGNVFIEGTAAAAPAITAAPGRSIARHPNGQDTNNNQSDFTDGPATPKASN